ncbi:hypothetical protein Anas_12861 [Armadillidium nasatum]|uniref:Uncharacterized protein n=1 Tax=Armadillidium nasatum TaxID=96803 RepID=A0A5N5T3D3_9CRUS|nr:hypothetical protein Anas_12861 [Armadillidium nasatum]
MYKIQYVHIPNIFKLDIWNSPVDELVEEVGVSSDQIESPKLLGTVQNLSLPGRPSLEFLTRISSSAKEVQQLSYKKSLY